MRLDLFLAECDFGLSRRKIRQVIDAGGVYINRKRARIASRALGVGDRVDVEFDLERLAKIRANNFTFTPADILLETDDFVVVNKPPGLPSQATRDQAVVHVETVLKNYYKNAGIKIPKLVLVHRLDKETSGALVVAKSDRVATFLSDQFRERAVGKEYHAICYGVFPSTPVLQRCFLSAIDKHSGDVRPVHSGGKLAVTKLERMGLSATAALSLIRCLPETGRTHQIRVHLNMLGHGIVGDKRYTEGRFLLPESLAALAVEHHFLHARKLGFRPLDLKTLPKGQEVLTLEAPYPRNFRDALALLRLEE